MCDALLVESSIRSRPPEELRVGDIVLRRPRLDDAEGIAAAVGVSMAELRPWMPWASDEAAQTEFQRRRLERALLTGSADELGYVIVEDGAIIGAMGLIARIGPGGLEIGYWLRSDRTGRGIATACAGALTSTALDLPGITRVEIHCDEANTRSAEIPRRLGYRLDRVEPDDIAAPGETGRSMIWVFAS